MSKTNIRYWLCQFFGWGLWGLIIIYFNLVVFADRFEEQGGKKEFLITLSAFLIMGILSTHFLRMLIKATNWFKYAFNNILVLFFAGVGGAGLLLFFGEKAWDAYSPYSQESFSREQRKQKAIKIEEDAGLEKIAYYSNSKLVTDSAKLKVISDIKKNTWWHRNKNGEWKYENKAELLGLYQNLLLVALWMLIYIVYHYVQRSRNDQMDRLKLETTVKELELKTIKSHINPHFIFNSLNSIRALVDENPSRARRAVTELSNILRSSMQAEKSETVSLEKELSIVNDYLALEHMRFEERLQVEMVIDEDTLGQQIPPMMLQTLVENAIKHGISKRIDGGFVKITSDFIGDHHELTVQNTGQLNGYLNKEGFGIQSTEDRLNLLYHGKASFEIKNITECIVESKVILPLNS
jgi:two-component system, LytTR family, sensor kinase